MSGFHDVQFPPEISYGATGGVEFSTIIARASRSKKEWRDIGDEEGVIRWNVAPGCTDDEKRAELIAFIRNRYGNAYSFRFKDWTDYQVSRQVVAVGDGATTVYQLIKTYTDGVFTVERAITKPIVATVQVWIGGVLQAVEAYGVDGLTGVLTFTAAPADTLEVEAELEFDTAVRFEKDGLKVNLADFDKSRAQITVREVFGE